MNRKPLRACRKQATRTNDRQWAAKLGRHHAWAKGQGTGSLVATEAGVALDGAEERADANFREMTAAFSRE